MRITPQGLKILEILKNPKNVKSISDESNLDKKKVRYNYIKKYCKFAYIERVAPGYYKLSDKGQNALRYYQIMPQIEKELTSLAKSRTSNEKIISNLTNKFNVSFSHSAIYTKISRLRTKENIDLRNKNKAHIPDKFSKELAEVIGLIFTDGYISKYDICFYNKDSHLLDRFEELIKRLFEIKHFKRREKQPSIFESRCGSIDVIKFLQSLIKNKTTVPSQILNGTDGLKCNFLKSYFSGDGSAAIGVSFKPKKQRFEISPFLAIACMRPKITNQLHDILSSLGFKHISMDKNGLRLSHRKDIKRFYKKIGFVNGCKTYHTKYWMGFEKNQILKFIATKLPDPNLNSLLLGEKQPIVDYIRNKLSE